MGAKTCRRCKVEMPIEKFGRHKSYPDGRKNICSPCRNSQRRERYNALGPEGKKAMYKKSALNRHYGMTLEQWNDLFNKQNGRCAICEKHQTEVIQNLCVDHDHSNGKIRGLLCHSCNRGLGLLQDSPVLTHRATIYLNRSKISVLKEG